MAMHCPGCRRAYSGPGMFLLYSDESGVRCGGCGEVLVPSPGEPGGGARPVLLPAGLAGSDLHGRLAGLPGVEVLLCRGGAVRPAPAGALASAGRCSS
ncbi:hypothetical protein Rxycam_00227 [Rubrobacter xylanophilus DSM 9941]|nr:hypothetical protein Rxycam_00227 [Rubrobacter xylanophilus DSM 9941]